MNPSALLDAVRPTNKKNPEERRATEKEQRLAKEAEVERQRAIRAADDELHVHEVPGITAVICEELRAFHQAIMNAPDNIQSATERKMMTPLRPTRVQRRFPWLFKVKSEEKSIWDVSLVYEPGVYDLAVMDEDGAVYLVTPVVRRGQLTTRLVELHRTTFEGMGYSFVCEFLRELRFARARFDRMVERTRSS